jgi:hypothetical protein
MRQLSVFLALTALAVLAATVGGACAATSDHTFAPPLGSSTTSGGQGAGGGGGGLNFGPPGDDPTTCAEAAMNRTYIGCDFWPTPVANNVWSIFDYAAVVANAGVATATITVTQRGATIATAQVEPNALTTIYLPWVPELKGADSDVCGNLAPLTSSVTSVGGAYHLVSSAPVTVFQFNALEYQGMGGPEGKDWSSCPGNQTCPTSGQPVGCFSFTNDASLLLPSTAMTGNYRITSEKDWAAVPEGAYFAITGTQANTSVTVYVAQGGHIVAGNATADTAGGGMLTFTLGAGDVAELVSDGVSDIAGSLVKASAPVQIIAGMPCVYQPFETSQPCFDDNDCPTQACSSEMGGGFCLAPACDHLEQTVLPAETLGKHYFVTVPTGPDGAMVSDIVRIVGNADGTNLTYPSGNQPAGAPATLSAGQVVDLGEVSADFEIQGDHEFAVVTFMLGASIIDPVGPLGDPSQSNAIAVEQYRYKYVFLAPTDYTQSFVDIVQPMSAMLTVDGAASGVTPVAIGSGSGFGIARVPLGGGQNNGAHVIEASEPVGAQVIGYGSYTSYQYPGGMNLVTIATPPPPPM